MVLQDSAIITAPDPAAAEKIRTATAQISTPEIVIPERLGTVLDIAEVRGPAALAYTSDKLFQPAPLGASTIEQFPAGDPALNELLESSPEADRDESGLDEITSPAFSLRSAGSLVSAAGHQLWPNHTAHISVFTAPDQRGHGLARTTASAAAQHALTSGLIPQWRARTPESRRVATTLGFHELGTQLSFRLQP
ncbi:GNAT family N-acetyltransferase [Nocardia sp. NPDC020380]|uniref:GNAT family N-acetyltransferase n=1 Tax=Nocardia sp. NPDC020380 TaxID=3364309 RepID=UPI00378BE8B8